jgi:hypothetical protein
MVGVVDGKKDGYLVMEGEVVTTALGKDVGSVVGKIDGSVLLNI